MPGVHELQNVAIISFRGTKSFQNIRTDLTYTMVPLESRCMVDLARKRGIEGATAHSGFQSALMGLRDDMIQTLHRLDVSLIWVIGHSLGGGLATLMAMELRLALQEECDNIPIAVCTFGSPKVGN